jgi:calcineurin-like phosphoesterase
MLLALHACTIARDPSHLEANIIRPGNFKAGSGIIESIGSLREGKMHRLYLRMDAGGFQTVDIDSERFFQGQAVELTNDGRVVLVSGTTFHVPR